MNRISYIEPFKKVIVSTIRGLQKNAYCSSVQRKRVTDELMKMKIIFSSIDLLHVECIYRKKYWKWNRIMTNIRSVTQYDLRINFALFSDGLFHLPIIFEHA